MTAVGPRAPHAPSSGGDFPVGAREAYRRRKAAPPRGQPVSAGRTAGLSGAPSVCPVCMWARPGPPVVAPAPGSGDTTGGRAGRKGRRVCSAGRRAHTTNVAHLMMTNGWAGRGGEGSIAPVSHSAPARATVSCTTRRIAQPNRRNGRQAEVALVIHLFWNQMLSKAPANLRQTSFTNLPCRATGKP